jgi:putative Mg2+ transporter-C (MgtC) family protein
MVVSKYGFFDLVGAGVTLDPSRVAAQIVSGIGFIGGGLIFVRRDAVRGLTTSAAIWLTAAIGMACGAGSGMQWIAAAVTAAHLGIMLCYTRLARLLEARSNRQVVYQVEVRYLDGKGALRHIINRATALGFTVERMVLADTGASSDLTSPETTADMAGPPPHVELTFRVSGRQPMDSLAAAVTSVNGVAGLAITPSEDDGS